MATTVVAIPSDRVPALPSFEVSVPTTWRERVAPGAVVAFDVEQRPHHDVVISALRVAGRGDLRDLAVRTFARQRAVHPGATIRSQRTGRFDGRLTYLREVDVPGDGSSSSQLHALFVLPAATDDWADVVSVVATCPVGELDELGPPTIDLVASFRPIGS